MYHDLEVPVYCQKLWQTCHSLVPEIINGCNIKTVDLKITTSNPVDPQTSSVFYIKEGIIKEVLNEQIIVIHEKGDLINADGLTQAKMTSFETDFAVTVDEYDGQQLLNTIFSDKSKVQAWTQYLSCLSQSYQIFANQFCQQGKPFSPEFRHYKSGDVIIEENTEGDEVFTLLSGSAKVMSDNKEVGKINKDEIFGAIAALTNTNRIASIIATSDCDTIVVKNDNFLELLSARPDTVQKLIQDMARTIVSSNNKIIELSSKK